MAQRRTDETERAHRGRTQKAIFEAATATTLTGFRVSMSAPEPSTAGATLGTASGTLGWVVSRW
jgi:hypothetical protein